MSTPSILHRLYSLDTSSPDLSRHLYCLIRHDEWEHYLSNLQGSELARLVDFLDQVRTHPPALYRSRDGALQAIDAIPANPNISRGCLYKLQEICGHRSTLPSSYVVSDGIVRTGRGPVAVGAIADVWEGTYRRNKVSIKCFKIPPGDDQTLKKVRVRYHTSLSRPLKDTRVSCSRSSKRPLCGNG